MNRLLRHSRLHAVVMLVTLLAAGCTAGAGPLPEQPARAAPTVSTLFQAQELKPQPLGWPTQPALRLQAAASPIASPTPDPRVHELAVYDDTLNPDWSVDNSEGMGYWLSDSRHVYSGTVSAAVTPQQDFGRFFFTVRQGASQTYSIDRVFAVSIWLNSGAEALDPKNLAVTVLGSNDYTYWTPDDKSVKTDAKHFFGESRLNELGINRTIPPDTWVEIDVWLDNLPYSPDYKYITGIYIKNDAGFRRTFYVDQVHLLLAE